MNRLLFVLIKQCRYFAIIFVVLTTIGVAQWSFGPSFITNMSDTSLLTYISNNNITNKLFASPQQTCSCTRPILKQKSNNFTKKSLCNAYSTSRGFHQRVIAISLFGPKENQRFIMNQTLQYLHELIADKKKVYPGWILRIYHDASIKEDIICPIECEHNDVDFCDVNALTKLSDKNNYIPPRIWRFLPAGDELVDVMGSRDLDSPLVQREVDAVNEWLSTNKAWHVMRDSHFHCDAMLAGLWGFRPALNRTSSRQFLQKILNRTLITMYKKDGDQDFLRAHVWPHIQDNFIAHDSYTCNTSYGKNSQPWPSQRPTLNSTFNNCFVGCVRSCCVPYPWTLKECPLECRPKNHPDWLWC
ncbi:unnamed protein product [Adineta steineri]|uniref:Uncharacterized protein n=1 Tax=Adineta steineri TaxID=433720 RepID=A0A814E6X2_9BILA|nr:unnamed protein product [Adineta steineri]CAF3529263.1 unnamed protein product [Adineta steineri]